MKKFTKAELGKYNGKNGMPIFVAYQGKVYDVSGSRNTRAFMLKKGSIMKSEYRRISDYDSCS